MSLTYYNTKLGRKTPLETIEEGHVKLYVCGITAYDYCHIGHARSALVFDMIVRYMRYRGLKVTYIRNFTDIDDKIIKRAQEQNTSSTELADRFIDKFNEDMAALGVDTPTMEPKATEHVGDIIQLIKDLIAKDLAYQAGNDVYYKVESFANYGNLSGRNLEDMQAGARISINESKENPMDFALWKGSKPGEPTWESPWGPGRPGWHIECSAMSKRYLGDTFDIHGGGKDLIFPHHENEVAQSEGATGKTFAKGWIHHGFVTIKDEKMSKSLGNFLTIREVLEKYQAEALRIFVYSTHYRNPLDYSSEALNDATAALDRLYTCMAEISHLPDGKSGGKSIVNESDRDKLGGLGERFEEAMDNDFNTAKALGRIFDAVKDLNRLRQVLPRKADQEDINLLRDTAANIVKLTDILGVLQQNPDEYLAERQQRNISALDINEDEIAQLIQERTVARQNKEWAKSDEIRDKLAEMNILIKDGTEGTTWQVK